MTVDLEGVWSMPPSEQIAAQTISRLASEGYTSQLMKLPRPTLNELARRLVTPGAKRADTLRWLNEEKSEDLPAGAVDDNAFYRFAHRYGETFKRVWGEHSTSLLMAELSQDPRFRDANLRHFANNRVLQLVAQELLTAQTPDDLDTRRLNAIVHSLRTSEKLDLDSQKIAIDRDLAYHKAAKLERQVAVLQTQVDRLPERVKALQDRVDDLSKRSQKGERIPAELFASIREELAGLAPETHSAAEGGAV